MINIVNWVVKVSKLCNLRCRYCYEWDELGNKQRMSYSNWDQLLRSIKAYHTLRSSIRPVESRIIWHGGEPLLLPQAYFMRVIELQREVLGESLLAEGRVKNFIQTNLFAVPWQTVGLLHNAGFRIGVSMDVAGGVRLDLHGRETEHRVARNIDALRTRGIETGSIVVLAGHTAPHIVTLYDYYEAIGLSVRFLPLFEAPNNTPDADFALNDSEITDALSRLFVHWMKRGARIPVEPLMQYLWTIYNASRKRFEPGFDRRTEGEYAILVNTNGDLFQVMEAYKPEFVLGNVFQKPIADVLASPEYEASLQRDRRLRMDTCAGCEFEGICNELPLYESPRGTRTAPRCGYAFGVLSFMQDYVREHGITKSDLERILARFSPPAPHVRSSA